MSVPYVSDSERGLDDYCQHCHVSFYDHAKDVAGNMVCPIDKALARRPSGPFEEDPEDETS